MERAVAKNGLDKDSTTSARASNESTCARPSLTDAPDMRSFLFLASFGDVRFQLGIAAEHLLFVIGRTAVQYDVAYHDQQFLAAAGESASQRLLAGDVDQAFSDPTPKLLLGRPELVVVCADYAGRLLRFHFCHDLRRTNQRISDKITLMITEVISGK